MRLWPQPSTQFDVEGAFGTTRVYRYGSDRGEPIVLLHGHGANASNWYPQVEALGRAHPVYAVDTIDDPGGSVQRMALTGSSDAATWLDEVLTKLELERVHLVGVSYGGWLALNQAIYRPDRLATVTLLDPGGLEKVPVRFFLSLIAGLFAMLVPRRYRGPLARLLGNHALVERPEIMAPVLLAARAFRPNRSAARVFSDEELACVVVPTQLLLGARSIMLRPGRTLQRARRLLPLRYGEIVPGAGHGLPMEVPEFVNERILSFVRSATTSDHTQPTDL
jgi:pimeloyl-ACP methyl ester carboxylesterase